MESQNLDAIAAELRKQRNLIHDKATALRSELSSLEKDTARIDAELVAFSGEEPRTIAALREKLEKENELLDDFLSEIKSCSLRAHIWRRCKRFLGFSDRL